MDLTTKSTKKPSSLMNLKIDLFKNLLFLIDDLFRYL